MKHVRVPLTADAQIRIPFGPALLPLRTVLMLALASPLALVTLSVGALPTGARAALTLTVLLLAFTLAAPTRDGIWIGTWWVYRHCEWVLPTAVLQGRGVRSRVRDVAGALQVSHSRAVLVWPRRLRRLLPLLRVPSFAIVEAGVLRLNPGGCRGVLQLEGPSGSIGAEAYTHWCHQLVSWLQSIECPAQVIAVISHFDSRRARIAFDRRTQTWPDTPLAAVERNVAAQVAEQTIGLSHFVVLCPGLAAPDGIPFMSRITRAHRAIEADSDDAARMLQSAARLAAAAGISAVVAERDDIAALLRATAFGASSVAVARNGCVQMGDRWQLVVTVIQLPAMTHPGALVDALIRSRVQGVASLHVLPVDPGVAQRVLGRRAAMQQYVAREGNRGIDNQVALAGTNAMLAALAQRDLQACRIALSVAVVHSEREGVVEAAERLCGALRGQGFDVTVAGSPGLLPALATAPGGVPLGRSLQLTSDDVAECLVPALGTPFSDIDQPLVGVSEVTGAPVYLSVWTRPNHNAVIIGSSGSGKSVAAKTLLVRHLMDGGSCTVIDPDSEYRRLMNAVGGVHIELGDAALNPLATALEAGSPDGAAGLVLPVLNVMAGDEKGVREGRPIRRLPDEDQGWLYTEVAAFFRHWRADHRHEPIISDLVRFIQTHSAARALTSREEDRCRVITARLLRFTLGDRAHVFDRPSTFRLGDRPVAIGLRSIAMSYAADLTPALALVLTGVLSALARGGRRMLVVVDEAHRVTSDPDAGAVLGQLVRQARKYGAGVWMCSQQVDDFVGSALGRTLVATAATKLILGTEEAALAAMTEAFGLSADEVAATCPAVAGRGVLVSASERTVVRVVPGPAIMAVADSTPAWQSRHPTPVASAA